jgi:hypothetical protein
MLSAMIFIFIYRIYGFYSTERQLAVFWGIFIMLASISGMILIIIIPFSMNDKNLKKFLRILDWY